MGKFLCVADLHIGSKLLRSGSTVVQDWKQILDDLLQFIKDNQVTHLIIAGDVFDKSRITNQEIDVWRNFSHQCIVSGCRPVYIPGNHETESNQQGVALPSAVNPEAMDITGVFDLEENGPRVVGIAEGEQENVKSQIRKVGKCDLLVVHTAFSHLFEFDHPIDMSEVPDTVQNVLTGHIHKPDGTPGLASGGYVFSPGPLHATEAKQMGVLGGWLTEDLADPDEWKWHKISCQPVAIRDLDDYPEYMSLVKDVQSTIEQDWENSGNTAIPLTVDLKYRPDQRNQVLSIIRQFSDHEGVRFMKTVKPDEQMDIELDNISSEIEEGKYSITESIDTALQKTIPQEEQDVRDFIYPLVHCSAADARKKLREWLQEQQVPEISI